MDAFDKEFITEFFLDCDSVSTMNRLVVAIANVVSENNDNLLTFNLEFARHQQDILKNIDAPVPRKIRSELEDFHLFQNYSDEDYMSRFKLKKSTFEALINFLKEYSKKSNKTDNLLEKKVHIFLWLLISDASYRDVGLLFNLNKSSISHIFHEMSSLLAELRYHFISWPSVEEQHLTRIKVNSRYKFPNCVGFIDTCRFNIGSKRRKRGKLDTVLLQGVCDENLMFIDIHVGNIGQTKKKVFKNSSLAKELRNYVHFENHILGNSEYKLKKNLITPFSSEELLTSEEMKFNEVHWKARSYIGNAFELLKERFARLNHIDVAKGEAVNNLIISACVLHNFILLHEGCAGIKEEIVICDDGVTIDTDIVKTALEKRQFLCNYINYIDLDTTFTSDLDL